MIFKRFVFLLCVVTLLSSCHTREVVYLSNAQRDTAEAIMQSYAQIILPGDQLYIHVASQTPESVVPFNQETHTLSIDGNSVVKEEGQKTDYVTADISGYFVGEDGTIQFPILGKIAVAGLTHDSLHHYLEERLKSEGYVNDPQVTSELMNFRVTVVGEVANPQQIHVQGTRLTILEAIAICGDLTMDGRRDNVTVVRQQGGQQVYNELDLTGRDFLDSPCYYLRQNDIVYVEPFKRKQRRSDRNDEIPQYISIGVSLLSIIRTNINIARQLNRM